MKTFILILVIVVILGLVGYRVSKKAIDKISFSKPTIRNLNLSSIGNSFSTVDLTTTIENKNNFDIPVSGLYIELYYQGQLVGKSTVPSEKFIVPMNGSITITQNVTIYLNSTLNVAAKILSKELITFDYIARGIVFNVVPLQIRDSFIYS